MSNYQIILFVLFGFCAVIVLWYLVRAILYMRSHPDEFGWPHLVVLLLMIGIQPVSADNNQPRFMIPTADIDDAGISGISLITPGNPYFTVYLWYRNTNYDNTYWKEAPVITIDGHSIQLTGLCGSHAFETPPSPGVWKCYDRDNLYYTVRARGGFKVKDKDHFADYYPDLKKCANYKDDYYMPLDVYIPNNRFGDRHTVTARGYMHTDKGFNGEDEYVDVLGLNDSTHVKSGSTSTPFFEGGILGTSLTWAPTGKLTYTSDSFSDKDCTWGSFRVVLDGKQSALYPSGVISVTKDYGSAADYRSNDPLPIEFRFEGSYDPANPSVRSAEKGKRVYNAGDFHMMAIEQNRGWKSWGSLFLADVNTWVESSQEATELSFKHAGWLSFKCLDRKICHVRLITDGKTVAEWDCGDNPQYECKVNFDSGIHAESLELTYELTLTGYAITFIKDTQETPQSLPYPADLTPAYNAWNKTTTLTWNAKNVNDKTQNDKGVYHVFRNGTKLSNVDVQISTDYKYEDDTPAFDQTYDYKVYFIPEGWDVYEESLSTSVTARLERTVSISGFEATALSDGYRLDWNITPELDKSGYMFRIYRRVVPDSVLNPATLSFDGLEPIKSVEVVDRKASHYSYDDKGVSSTATYAYLIRVYDIQDTTITSGPVIPEGHPNASHVRSLVASRGAYTDHVHLAWDETILGSDELNIEIYRHKINEGEDGINTAGQAQQLDWVKLATLVSTADKPVVTYDDMTAVGGYYYVYAVVARTNGSSSVLTRTTCDGFVRSTGTVYGSVTYADGKFAVEGVKMQLTDNATTDAPSLFNSVGFTGGNGGIHWDVTPERFTNYFSGPFSVQMYVRPDANTAGACLFDMDGQLRLSLGDYDADQGYPLTVNSQLSTVNSQLRIKPNHFTHVTFTYDGSGHGALHVMAADSLGAIATETFQLDNANLSPLTLNPSVAVASAADSTQTLSGYVDEVRFFKRCLTEADVKQNYSHYMGGMESGLVAYWPFDEGISTLRWAYDYSTTSGVANENHAGIFGGRRTGIETPTADQLSLYAVTDTLGAYTLRGIPFTGEGTTYSLIPTKGAHGFTPTTRTLYVSASTLTFDPQNFEDNSSFHVKGVVYYENTTYPVKGCRFRVDDTVVKDEWGNEILSNADGEFTIPVSIGQHAIYIEKEGHEFLNSGRYPAEGLHNFNDSISGLTFTDLTKAIVVGRVAGGAVEKGKPIALGRSRANIGAATLTLLTSSSVEDARRMNVTLDSEEGVYNSNPEPLYYKQANPEYVNSTAWVDGTNSGTDGVKRITIKTDPKTGEFSVLLPPVPYYVTTTVDNNSEATAYLSGQVMLDCSNVTNEQTSSDDERSMTYNTAFVQTYFSAPVIDVRQSNNEVGAFGDAKVPAGELNDSVATYKVTDGQLTYNYGYPIFTSCQMYEFGISAYEQYFNYDSDPEMPLEDQVPSTEGYLTFKNPMVLTADTVGTAPLDSLGRYIYRFQAIDPNEVAPYTQPIAITLTIGDNVYSWNWQNGDYEGAMQCVVLGAKLTGESSVTAAPDKLINILRDPFGSSSNQVWEKDQTISWGFDVKIGGTLEFDYGQEDEMKAGSKMAVGVPGVYTGESYAISSKGGAGFKAKGGVDVHGGATWDFTTTKTFSTSSESIYDGPDGDVFIGATSSLIYGDGLQVMLVDDQTGGYQVGTQEIIATGEKLETTFSYSQNYIITQLIPEFKRLREARLIQVSEAELEQYRSSFKNNTDSIIYMTSLKPTDSRFGSNNDDVEVWGDEALKSPTQNMSADGLCSYGPSYTVFLPANGQYKDEEEHWDAIVTLNSNINQWEYFLALNEETKVKTFLGKSPKNTYSFDSGSSLSYSHKKDSVGSEGLNLTIVSNTYGKFAWNVEAKNGGSGTEATGTFSVSLENVLNPQLFFNQSFANSYTVNLVDNVDDNVHEVEMYDAGDGYGYVFRQVSGQTSCYYEGEERTKYYEPGRHILSNATVQIQVPHIDCAQPVVTGVPADQPATFELKLSNATMADLTRNNEFKLLVVKDKWASMAEVEVNGMPGVNEYDVTLAPKENYNLTLKVRPASKEIIHIDSLHLYFYSKGEPELGDDIWLTAYFQPQAEPIELAASRTLVNTATDSTLVLTASGYNSNSSILNGVRLQQRKEGAPEWTTIHSWVKGTPAGDTESALPAERIDTLVDMHSSIFYPDATYEFRAVTDCTVSGEQALGESETITVIKDVTLPQPIMLPEPADGVMNEGDNISVTFNEDIYSQSLNKPDNFIIQSVLNTDSVAHDVALRLDGAATPVATSQSQLMLGGTSFTLCSWVKSGDSSGTLFRHGQGQNAFRVSIDGDGYLTTYITDENGMAQPYKSTKALPKDIWAYVAVVYDVDAGTLSAYYASGDNEEVLMSDVAVGTKANSQGNIYLGEGLTGAMHELSLFSAPLTWTTVKAQMYLGKSHSTPALIGYWRLDEGHGTTSEDRARSRNMILVSPNSWYMENPNLSMAVDGTHCAAIPMGTLSTTEGASYLVEMWALADESQGASVQLLSLDNGQKLDVNITADGALELVADSTSYLTTLAVNDHQWHHVALNVLKGGSGQANLMVDGVSVLTVAADKVPALAGARLWLGRNMKGMIDEVRLWHGMNTQETVCERMYYRLDGNKESGLVGYYPMENTYYDEYNQRVFMFSTDNKGYQATASTTLVTDAEGVTMTEGSDAPGLKTAPHKSNLDFSFVADERTVSITLDHGAKSIEGCTVSTTLRDYYDLHTNVGTPVTWNFTVKQNTLSWDTPDVSVRTNGGWDSDFTATLTNNGPADQSWSMADLPSWLEASPSSGTIFAHGSQEVTFTVLPGKAIGKYFTTVSARGNKELDTPLDICLTVEGERPDWTPTIGDESMAVIGQIKVNGVVSTDPDDMVGAFTSPDGESLGECIGVGQPKYNSNKDAYFVTMLVYGDKSIKDSLVRFRIYDASTGKVYPLTTVSKEIRFKADASEGSTSAPVIWENMDKLLQTFELHEGTQWISVYLNRENKELAPIFQPVSSLLGNIDLADGTTITPPLTDVTETIDVGQMMKVKMNADGMTCVIGDAVNPADYPITIKPGVNWVGVTTSTLMTVDEAFAGLAPEEGDQVKNLTAISYYENGTWEGTLGAIEPGKGYIYTSMAEGDKQFTFPNLPEATGNVVRNSGRAIAANYKYLHNMVAVCTIHDEYGQPTEVNAVKAYDASGELRGQALYCYRDSLYFVVISGDVDGEPIIITPEANGMSAGKFGTVITFKRDDCVGRPKQPLVIKTDLASAIDDAPFLMPNAQLTVYDLRGQLVYRGSGAQFDRNMLRPNTVYIVSEVTEDGRTFCRKMEFNKQ